MPDDEEEDATTENTDKNVMIERARPDMEQTDLLVEIAENNAEEDTLF